MKSVASVLSVVKTLGNGNFYNISTLPQNVTEMPFVVTENTTRTTTTVWYNRNDTEITTFSPYLDNVTATTTTVVPSTFSTVSTTPVPCVTSSQTFNSTLESFQNLSTTTLTSYLNQSDGVTSMSLDPEQMSKTAMTLILLPLVVITLFIILGNILVVVAVFTKRSLRTPQNIYIVSLALTDMGVAVFVLPYNMTTLVLRKWIFGLTLCKLYLTMDVSLCCVSIFHLCAIGIDRYRAITDGIHYVQKRNLKSVLVNIAVLWVIALWIGSPTWLAISDGVLEYDGVSCEMPDSAGFNFHLAVGALFFPLVIMTVIYVKIYRAIQERLRERARVTCMELTSDADTTERTLDNPVSSTENDKKGSKAKRKASAQISSFLVTKQKFSLSKERKAAQTLGIIMAAFIFCWLPLGFLNLTVSLLPIDQRPNPIWFHTFTWLGYVNSALNPIIYGISNQEYRNAFRNILRFH